MRRLALAFLMPLIPSFAMAAQSSLTPIVETEHFRFLAGPSTSGALKVDAKASERVFGELSSQLGVSLEGKIEYQRLEFPEQVAVFAGDSSLWTTGVAHPESLVIQSTLPSHPHEIVHILSHQLGRPSAFFVEGLAVELGDRGRLYGQSVDSLARQFAQGPTRRADAFVVSRRRFGGVLRPRRILHPARRSHVGPPAPRPVLQGLPRRWARRSAPLC